MAATVVVISFVVMIVEVVVAVVSTQYRERITLSITTLRSSYLLLIWKARRLVSDVWRGKVWAGK